MSAERDPAGRSPFRALVSESYRAFQSAPLLRPHADFAFERREEIARGGLGRVYRVFDRRLKREAALKVLKETRSSKKKAERFLRESRVMALLDHPCIPPVYEYGVDSRGEHYLLMKLIRGRTLREQLKDFHRAGRRPRALAALLRVMIKVCEALSYAHARGVIHRDIKPENIMIGLHGEVYLMDWGLARHDEESEDEDRRFRLREDQISESVFEGELSVRGGVVGTFGYMAPEQAMGEAVSTRSDLYSLGAILFEILTGDLAVSGSGVAAVVAAMDGRIDFPADYGQGFPRPLARIARACLSKEPDRRPAEVREVLDALRASLSEGRGPRLAKRGLVAAALLSLILTVSLAIWLLPYRDRAQRSEAALERLEAERTTERSKLEAEINDRERRIEALARSAAETPSRPLLASELTILGDQALERRDKDSALRYFNEALAADSESVEALFRRANMRRSAGELAAAITDYNRAIELAPRDARIYNNRGLSYRHDGQTEKAFADFEKAIAINERYALAYYNRGNLREKLGETDRALEDYERVIVLDPGFALVYYNRACIREAAGDLRGAAADFVRNLELAPRSVLAADARTKIAELRRRLGE